MPHVPQRIQPRLLNPMACIRKNGIFSTLPLTANLFKTKQIRNIMSANIQILPKRQKKQN
jgi:hypothetical protein